jgi:hypothetical protein
MSGFEMLSLPGRREYAQTEGTANVAESCGQAANLTALDRRKSFRKQHLSTKLWPGCCV